jgi:hypothetical protein
MNTENEITSLTRRNIAEALQISNLFYNGRLEELEFLLRLYDIKKMKSEDKRFTNAWDDIIQHRIRNYDWADNWIFFDNRFNLMNCEDEEYLNFISETIHPLVRNNEEELEKILNLYNKYLKPDGYEIVEIDEISGNPIYAGRKILSGKQDLMTKSAFIKTFLDTDYVTKKIKRMTDSLDKDNDLAIGTAKELLETMCKSILKQKGIEYDYDWSVSKLINTTTKNLDFMPKNAEDPEKAKKSIVQILSGISTAIQGLSELRNAYGSGHGKEADFKPLETVYAKLYVSLVSDLVIFYLSINGENTEIVE